MATLDCDELKHDGSDGFGLTGVEPVDQAVQLVAVVRLGAHATSVRLDRSNAVGAECQDGGMAMWLTADPQANELLASDPLALLTGMLLDQQIPMEKAFAGPKVILDRLGRFDARSIAEADTDEFVAMCSVPPAIHRFPGSMAKRVQELCRALVERYDGDPAAIWTVGEPDGETVLSRLMALPGFGQQKARIFVALLGKQYGVRPVGWREAAGPYGEDGIHKSVADVTDEASLQQVRSYKKEMKAAARSA